MASRSIRMYFPVALLAIAVSFVSGDCIYLDLGMQRGSIPDNKITASSTLNASTPARNGRLNYTAGSSWCASANDSNPYLQINLQSLHIICAVSTQGNSKADEWVETYTMQTSKDGLNWTDYENAENLKTFLGNYDRHSEVKNILSGGVLARWLRFVGKAAHNKFCMRVEIFGVKRNPENLALNKPTVQSTTHNISSGPGNAVDGNRNPLFDANGNCAVTSQGNPSWWRVDLGANNVPVADIFIVNRLYPPSEISEVFYDISVGNNVDVTRNPGCQGWCQFKNFIGTCGCYQSPLRTGRYVGIITTLGPKRLSLCEVEVYSRENIAQGKPTKQIRPHSSTPSDRAVDGDTNLDTCSALDQNVTNPWWRVDLGQEELVNEVYIVT